MTRLSKHYAKVITFNVDRSMDEALERRREETGVPTSEFLRRLIASAIPAQEPEVVPFSEEYQKEKQAHSPAE